MMKGSFPLEINTLSLADKILKILIKELKTEWRSKVSINALLLFSIITLVLISYSIGPHKIPENEKPDIFSALLLLSLFFSSSLGLSRVFVKEEEQKTSITLKMALDPLSIFLGKLFFNLILLLSISIVITPLFLIFMEFYIKNLCYFIIIMFFTIMGLTIVSTFISAIISKASLKGALFPILTFPITMPLILEGTKALSISSSAQDLSYLTKSLIILISFSGVAFFGSIILFEKVWKE